MDLEKMRPLETDYPDIQKEFKKDHFVVQAYSGCFKATSPDMCLEQTI